jgi:hypothetical protein
VTWGEYHVVGTWDGEYFTLTEGPRPPQRQPRPGGIRPITPCPPPPGGWQVVDPATTTSEALESASVAARAEADFAGDWVDQSSNPNRSRRDGQGMNDPTKLIANFCFTGDLPRHKAELRQIWGGAMCVSEARRTHAELGHIHSELSRERRPDWLGTSDNVIGNVVDYIVIIDDGRVAPARVRRPLRHRRGRGSQRAHPHRLTTTAACGVRAIGVGAIRWMLD